jgi:hypothetical protein
VAHIRILLGDPPLGDSTGTYRVHRVHH